MIKISQLLARLKGRRGAYLRDGHRGPNGPSPEIPTTSKWISTVPPPAKNRGRAMDENHEA